MNISRISLFGLLLFLPFFSASAKDAAVYKGAWFDVNIPKGFTVKPSQKSESIPDKYDSVYFISPDKKVKFYIYSPQWTGDASDIAINSDTETEQDVKTDKKKNITQKWYTYMNKKTGAARSYHETVSEDGPTKHILGFEYADSASQKKYRDAYLQFKKSLKQYAD